MIESWFDAGVLARHPLLSASVLALALALAASVAVRVLLRGATRIAAMHAPGAAFLATLRMPAAILAAALAAALAFNAAPEDLRSIALLRHVATLCTIGAFTWTAIAAVHGVAASVAVLHPLDRADNLAARRIQTQARVLARTLSAVVAVVGLALALITFPNVRQVGASLLASAGVAGLVAGLAARPVLGNLIAGLQIALTQPLRIDDVLIVDGEWGRVEEIGSAYIVLRIWDERRLIIPLQYLIEKPFQNWTRQSAELLGTVFLWVDAAMPVAPLRDEALRVCKAAPEWDGRVCIVQVTDTSETAVQLRVLVSSGDSARNFDLRCKVREALVGYLQRTHPEGLVRTRLERAQRGEPMTSAPAGGVNVN
ncbi:MAG: mechanosensitive ion channel [Proteobacteria bacterium]|nr:mechanosensitive ion channel [Pseudomonadota bacterium]